MNIKKYLKSQGIERISNAEYERRAHAIIDSNYSFYLLHEKAYHNPKLTPADIYELQQNHRIWYDYRVDFLKKFSWIVKSLDFTNAMESGCASGIDTCYLALRFPDKTFSGYDIQEQMVEHAQNRADQSSLNIEFFVSDNNHPEGSADLVFNNCSLIKKGDRPEPYIDEAIAIGERVNPNGYLALAGLSRKFPLKPLFDSLDFDLEKSVPYHHGHKIYLFRKRL